MTSPAPHRRVSLTGQLFRRILILLAAIIVVIGSMIFWTAQNQVNKLYDGQLITGANVLRALMMDEIRERSASEQDAATMEIGDELLSEEDRKAFHAYADWRMFRLWKDGRLILASDTGPTAPRSISGTEGFSMEGTGRDAWRLFTLPLSDADVTVQIGERVSIRAVIIQRIMLELVVPLLLLVPLSMLLIWLSLADGLQALRTLVGEIGRRGPADLAPLAVEVRPFDLEPLATSVNGLMRRLEESSRQERRFIDNAAHQLRTPLAALSLQAQLIAREDDAQQRSEQVVKLREAVSRAADLTEQLLTLARIGSTPSQDATIDLHAEAVSVLAETALVATARNVSLALDGETAPIVGDPAMARLILANLVENAVANAPADTEVHIKLSADASHSYVVVADSGRGIPAAERQRVFERFFRGADAKGTGSGLGLSIVEEAARNLNAAVTLHDRTDGQSGLEARLTAPRRLP